MIANNNPWNTKMLSCGCRSCEILPKFSHREKETQGTGAPADVLDTSVSFPAWAGMPICTDRESQTL